MEVGFFSEEEFLFSEKAVKEGTLHLEQMRFTMAFTSWESNFVILILKNTPAQKYLKYVVSRGQTSWFSWSLRTVAMNWLYF